MTTTNGIAALNISLSHICLNCLSQSVCNFVYNFLIIPPLRALFTVQFYFSNIKVMQLS